MKRWLWNLRFAVRMYKLTRIPWDHCWHFAEQADEFHEGQSPSEAVDSTVEYWDAD